MKQARECEEVGQSCTLRNGIKYIVQFNCSKYEEKLNLDELIKESQERSISRVIVKSKQLHESPSSLRDDQTQSQFDLPTCYRRDIGKIQDITNQLLPLIHRNRIMEINVVWLFCFPSHNQNERNVRDMANYDIKQ